MILPSACRRSLALVAILSPRCGITGRHRREPLGGILRQSGGGIHGQAARRKSLESVELNLAAMLDMAFQLLTFFILTFRPAPLEGRIDLRMPPPHSATPNSGTTVGTKPDSVDPLANLTTLVIEVLSGDDGAIGTMHVGGRPVDSLPRLERRLSRLLADPGMPFRQVVIQVGSGLRYDALMSVIDVCSRQRLASGEELKNLSFVEVADRSG